MKLDRASYEKCIKGYFLLNAVVRRRDMFYFVFEEERDEEKDFPKKKDIRTRVVYCLDDPVPEDIWGYASLKGMQRLQAGVSFHPKEQFVGVSLNDHVYVLGSGDDELEQNLPTWFETKGHGLRGGIGRLRTIDGYLYGCGLGRTVIKRLGRNQWHMFLEIPDKDKHEGFHDIDGFASDDIYAAGGHGDLWHFDGTAWKQVPFPSNMTLESLCCAGDGEVYIGAESGTLFKGRGNRWKLIERNAMALPFRDMVWFQDKVWCTSDYGLWVIHKDKAVPADVPASVSVCAGHLSVGDGVMLLAGIYGAVLHDGRAWQPIIDFNDLD